VVRGKINIVTAPREVLMCLPGLEETDVNNIISQRSGNSMDTSNAWVSEVLQGKPQSLTDLITTRGYQYSADIVAASGNGRAFKRCRIVIDTRAGSPVIVYRKDLTERGWPMDREILSSLRSGGGVQSGGMTNTGSVKR
jgi:hypothetical protein